MEPIKEKVTKNRRERVIAFVYVCLFFIVTTTICCILLSYTQSSDNLGRKTFAIAKMDRIRSYQAIQSKQFVVVDSLYHQIRDFNPGINASYEESDIKFYLNDLKSLYNRNSHDGRYKIFLQISNFYGMWFTDRKELWSKQTNIKTFKKNLEDCETGLHKRIDELKNTK